jgi:hypothetical protein
MHVTTEHRFKNVDVDRFVDVYYSREFNHAVAPSAALKVRDLVDEVTLDGGNIKRRVRMVPDITLPGPVARLVNGPIEFFEVSEYDPKSKSAAYHVESAAEDRIVVRGQVTFTQDGDDVVRKIAGEVHVKMLGVGGIIERLIAGEVRGRYDRIQAFTQQYLDDHAERPSA